MCICGSNSLSFISMGLAWTGVILCMPIITEIVSLDGAHSFARFSYYTPILIDIHVHDCVLHAFVLQNTQ